MLFDVDDITTNEKSLIESQKALIVVLRSSFSINNMEIETSYENLGHKNLLIYPIYLQDKKVTIKNLHTKVQGGIMLTSHPLNLHLENLDVNLEYASGGFHLRASCGYPEAALDGLVYIKNLTIYYETQRGVFPFEYDMFSYIGPATVETSDMTLLGFVYRQEGLFAFYVQPPSS